MVIGPEVTRWFPHGRILAAKAEFLGRVAPVPATNAGAEALEPIYLREINFIKAPVPKHRA
jgi:hypothetical protein